MNYIDWAILFLTIFFIVGYGTWKTRGSQSIEGYLKGDNTMKWWMIGISIMATQASAITFLSTPGQAIVDGMRFIQFYFGLPIAMVIISVTMVPIYYKLKVYTAYEYLESRFDLKTRLFTALLFLIQRGLSAGITLYAPALILSTILGWPVGITTVIIGAMVVIYVTSGGIKAVSLTQQQQMAVIMTGMIMAGVLAYSLLPQNVSFGNAVNIAGELGKLNMINLEFDLNDRYNIWSGLIAATFLSLSYFGTDQSQVARYLSGKSLTESRLGLMFNGLLKVPMQFIILFIGVLVFVFYLFHQPPVFHNKVLYQHAMETSYRDSLQILEKQFSNLHQQKQKAVDSLLLGIQQEDALRKLKARNAVLGFQGHETEVREQVRKLVGKAVPGTGTQDRDYIFLNFVLDYLPHGVIGLLLAVMFSAAMSSMAGEMNALSSTMTVDIYQRIIRKDGDAAHYLKSSRWFTIAWAGLAMLFALLASFSENLIQFVNIIGSIFYGTILGVFMTAFFIKYVKGSAVFWAALVAEGIVLYCYFFTTIAYLLYNVIGCLAVMFLALIFQFLSKQHNTETEDIKP